MDTQELMISLQKKLAIEKRSEDYLLQVYNAQMVQNYPNMLPSEGVYLPPTKKYIIDTNQTNMLSPTQQLQINLQTMLKTDDALLFIGKLHSDQIITLNQVFAKFTQDINSLKFNSINEFIDYTTKYIDKVNNNII